MGKSLIAALGMLGLPVVVFLGGAWLMSKLSHRRKVANQKPLNLRLGGYRVEDVGQLWEALGDGGRRAEKKFLELDLVFPFFYGAALATGMLLAREALTRPVHVAWILVPLAVTLLADWVENLVQLGQIKRFIADGKTGLQESSIRVASMATTVKLIFFCGSWLVLVSLIVCMLFCAA